jgi:hypothetical protein
VALPSSAGQRALTTSGRWVAEVSSSSGEVSSRHEERRHLQRAIIVVTSTQQNELDASTLLCRCFADASSSPAEVSTVSNSTQTRRSIAFDLQLSLSEQWRPHDASLELVRLVDHQNPMKTLHYPRQTASPALPARTNHLDLCVTQRGKVRPLSVESSDVSDKFNSVLSGFLLF